MVKLLGNGFILSDFSSLIFVFSRTWTLFSFRLINPHYWCKAFLISLSNNLWFKSFPNLANGNSQHFWLFVHQALASNPITWFLPFPTLLNSGSFPTHIHWSISVVYSRNTFCSFSGFSLCTSLFSSVLVCELLSLCSSRTQLLLINSICLSDSLGFPLIVP